MALIKPKYETPVSLTATNLHSMAASSTLVAGWQSAEIDNTTNRYGDYAVSGKLTLATGYSAGSVQVRAAAKRNGAYPSPLTSSEGEPLTFGDVTLRDAATKLLGAFAIRADPGTDDVYEFGPFSIREAFRGVMPEDFVIWIASTGALAASGNEVIIQGITFEIV